MDINQFAAWIGLEDEAIHAVHIAGISAEERQHYLQLFEQDETSFYQKIQQHPLPEQAVLSLFVWYAYQLKVERGQNGLTDAVFRDTMRDIALWHQQCFVQKGIHGLIEWSWVALSLKGRVVRIGRLQYMPRRIGQPIPAMGKVYPEDTMALDVHIPADGALLENQVDASINAAKVYFADQGYPFMYCRSWLLSPMLKRILPPDSNILAFQNRFTIYGEQVPHTQAQERVFGKVQEDISAYAEQTSLQRSLKALMLQGHEVGLGLGYIPLQ